MTAQSVEEAEREKLRWVRRSNKTVKQVFMKSPSRNISTNVMDNVVLSQGMKG